MCTARAQMVMNVHLIQPIAIPIPLVQTPQEISVASAILGFQATVSRAQKIMNVHLVQTIAIPMQFAPTTQGISLA